MPIRYIVQPGDHLAKIAADHGIASFLTLWTAGDNAELRKKRKNPNILFAGDVVVIPDTTTKHEDAATERRHRFVMNEHRLKLRIDVEDAFRAPLKNTPCELGAEGADAKPRRTDGNGRVEIDIPKPTDRVRLVIRKADTAFSDSVLDVVVGGLDPIDTIDGQSQRLVNLGYLATVAADRDAPKFVSAVQEFQCDHGLTIDGRCGPASQGKLEKVHGS
jgi:N-acetylmuramoyl-L-alanine amidase